MRSIAAEISLDGRDGSRLDATSVRLIFDQKDSVTRRATFRCRCADASWTVLIRSH